MFLKKAMRYYRLWIYTCNAVLLVSVLVFLGVAAGILAHPYIALVPTPPLYHPSLLYGYVALLLQAGIIQAIGCFGALRLSQKLLNIYFILLLSLLIGDILVGLVWVVKFATLTEGISTHLNMSIKLDYGKDDSLTHVWNTLQSEELCCGSENPVDHYWQSSSTILPNSCCKHTDPKVSALRSNKRKSHSNPYPYVNAAEKSKLLDKKEEERLKAVNETLKRLNITCNVDSRPALKGCAEIIKSWYKKSVETLMVLGFCVITFIKLCFVGILKFEIKEMIQKIKVLQGEIVLTPNPELAAALGMIPPIIRPETNVAVNTIVEEEPPKDTPQKPNHIFPHNDRDGGESDTNSNCALITDTPVRNAHPAKLNGNNNELTELRELRHVRQTEI